MTEHAAAPRRLTGRNLLIGLVALGIGLALALWQQAEPQADPGLEKLLNSQLKDPQGRDVDMAQYRGKVVVVNFWATWCTPCIQEMPELSEVSKKLSGKGVVILGLGIDEADRIQAFIKRLPVSYPLFALGAGGLEIAKSFGNERGLLPHTLIYRADGVRSGEKLGRISGEALTKAIEKALHSGQS